MFCDVREYDPEKLLKVMALHKLASAFCRKELLFLSSENEFRGASGVAPSQRKGRFSSAILGRATVFSSIDVQAAFEVMSSSRACSIKLALFLRTSTLAMSGHFRFSSDSHPPSSPSPDANPPSLSSPFRSTLETPPTSVPSWVGDEVQLSKRPM